MQRNARFRALLHETGVQRSMQRCDVAHTRQGNNVTLVPLHLVGVTDGKNSILPRCGDRGNPYQHCTARLA